MATQLGMCIDSKSVDQISKLPFTRNAISQLSAMDCEMGQLVVEPFQKTFSVYIHAVSYTVPGIWWPTSEIQEWLALLH